MIKFIATTLLALFAIAFLGSYVLEQVPELQPIWEESKSFFATFYTSAKVKYGAIGAVLLIFGLLAMFSTSNNKR